MQLPHVVIFHIDVLGPLVEAVVPGQGNSTLVVAEEKGWVLVRRVQVSGFESCSNRMCMSYAR